MAKRFGGFTPQQQQQLLSPLGYTGPAQQDDMNKFMMSSPQAASMMGKYASMAKARVEGGPQMAMHLGGDIPLQIEPGQSLADAANNQQIAADQAVVTQDSQVAAMNAANAAAVQRNIVGRLNNQFDNSNVMVAARNAEEKLLQESKNELGIVGNNPTTKDQADRLKSVMESKIANNREIKAARQAQLRFNQQMENRFRNYNNRMPTPRGPIQYPLMGQPMPTPPLMGQPMPTPPQIRNQDDIYNSFLDFYNRQTNPGAIALAAGATGYQVGGVVDDEQDMTNNQQQGMVGTMGGTDGDLGTAYGTDGNVGNTDTVDDGVSTDPVEPVYDPSQGLPDPVDNLYTDANKAYEDAFQTDFNAGTEGTNKNVEQDKSWAKTTVEQMANVADPKDYTLGTYVAENGKTYLQLEYPDGTVIPTGHRKQKYAIGRANILAAATNASKNVVTPEEKTALEQQYQDQLSQYEQYQTGQATTKAETPVAETIETAQNQVNVSTNLIAQYNKELAGLDVDDPKRTVIEKYIADEQLKLNQANADLTQAKDRQSAEKLQETKERTEALEADPSSAVTKADVSTISDTAKEAGKIGEGVGSAGEAEQATVTSVGDTGQATVPTAKDAATYTAEETQAAVKETLDALVAATGKPSTDALAEAQTMDPEELAQLGLTAAQIEEAVQVTAPDKRVAEEGELLDVDEDVTVDMERVEKEALNFEAATGTPSTEATVQGQLTGLMADFEGGEPPAWAAGAMRAATQQMAARGLAASSMAAQAIVQAAMESALPIAMQDAQTVASFEAQNLSNRQQVAMFAAEQRAKFLGMEFDQGFQIRVQNAAKIADIANQNFSAEVQISLENARLANTVDLANLDAKNAKILADAAAMTNVELANLNNRQQAAVQIANAFLQFDMAEFDAKQQVAIFKAEGNIQSILSDQAAVNAAEQFNATSENQTNQFYDSLIAQVEQFNVDQDNAMKKFEAEQANALAMFNTEQENKRAEFEATNALLIAQADAKWEQDIALTDTAATNEANNNEAKATNDMTKTVYEAAKLAERDMASYSFQTENNNADRATSVAIQVMQNEASADSAAASKSAAFATAAGAVIAKII